MWTISIPPTYFSHYTEPNLPWYQHHHSKTLYNALSLSISLLAAHWNRLPCSHPLSISRIFVGSREKERKNPPSPSVKPLQPIRTSVLLPIIENFPLARCRSLVRWWHVKRHGGSPLPTPRPRPAPSARREGRGAPFPPTCRPRRGLVRTTRRGPGGRPAPPAGPPHLPNPRTRPRVPRFLGFAPWSARGSTPPTWCGRLVANSTFPGPILV